MWKGEVGIGGEGVRTAVTTHHRISPGHRPSRKAGSLSLLMKPWCTGVKGPAQGHTVSKCRAGLQPGHLNASKDQLLIPPL